MINHISPWMSDITESHVEMSSRIRLARNIRAIPFPHMLKVDSRIEEMTDLLTDTLDNFNNITMTDLKFEDKALLVEKHLISPLFTERGYSTFINEDESASIMVNEEDHIRLQVMGADTSLDNLYEKALNIDEAIERQLDYAFDEQYGFLTACPTNVGTGLRASVMLHLPALSMNNQISRFQSNLTRFGFTLRGIYGEGSIPLGHIYQLSNQLTLGQTEEDIIDNLEELKMRIIEEELDMRQLLTGRYELETHDTVSRSLGILKHAYKLTLKEAAMHLSNVKLGADAGFFDSDTIKFQEWIQLIQPAFIKMRLNALNKEYNSLEGAVNEERATILREKLGGE